MNKIISRMYVRTPEGIKKVKHIEDKNSKIFVYCDNWYAFEQYLNDKGEWTVDEDIEAAFNIKVLIYEGDYVNGCKVININGCLVLLDGWNTPLDIVEVKSVVTKEQFEEMEYKNIEGDSN